MCAFSLLLMDLNKTAKVMISFRTATQFIHLVRNHYSFDGMYGETFLSPFRAFSVSVSVFQHSVPPYYKPSSILFLFFFLLEIVSASQKKTHVIHFECSSYRIAAVHMKKLMNK